MQKEFLMGEKFASDHEIPEKHFSQKKSAQFWLFRKQSVKSEASVRVATYTFDEQWNHP